MEIDKPRGVLACVIVITMACGFPTRAQGGVDDAHSAGGFIFKPALTISEEYDPNIYTEDSNEDGDFITRIKPELTIERAVKPHIVQIKFGAEQALYAADSDDDYLNYNAGLRTRYVFAPRSMWDLTADYDRLHAERGDDLANPTSDASEPIPYDRIRVKTSMTSAFGPITVTPRLGYMRYDYADIRRISGALLDQNFRDRDEYALGGRIAYDLKNDAELFADGDYMPRLYDDGTATERDSTGGEYLMGLRYKPRPAWMWEIAGGYMRRDYNAIGYDDIATWDASAKLEWDYADKGTVSLSAMRSIAEVTDAGTGGAIRTDMKASVTRELMPDLAGEVSAQYSRRDFEGGHGADSGTQDRKDHYYRLGAGVEYLVNDRVSLLGDYYFARNASNRDSAEYAQNVIMFGVRVLF